MLGDCFIDNEEQIERNYRLAQRTKETSEDSSLKINNARWKIYLRELVAQDLRRRGSFDYKYPVSRTVASIAKTEEHFPHLLILQKSEILKMYHCVD